MSYYNYYQNKEKRKAEALEHFRKMEILMKDEIGQSVKETKAYGGNGFHFIGFKRFGCQKENRNI